MFYDRYSDDNVLDLIELPPLLNTYTTNYTTIPELLASPLTATTDERAVHRRVRPADGPQLERGVQRDIGWNLVATSPTSATPHANSASTGPINGRPYGYRLPAVKPGPDQRRRGSAAAAARRCSCVPTAATAASPSATYDGYADYHSLQLALNRRRAADGLSVESGLHLRRSRTRA